uniref:FHA domain-containing protein n=1 Tax=Schlesneria paludicola TaxID=360056 RepID=A0A7C2NWJ8_9PLAN
MQAILRIVHQRANIQQVRLGSETVIGRSAGCQLKIASPQVSRRHCRLSLRPDGVYLEDLDSANGTFLDGVRVPKETPTYVHAGARLEIGPARFVVEYTVGGGSTKLTGPETQELIQAATPGRPSQPTPFSQPTAPTENGPHENDQNTQKVAEDRQVAATTDPGLFDFSQPAAESFAIPSLPRKRSFFDLFRRRSQTDQPSLPPADPLAAEVTLLGPVSEDERQPVIVDHCQSRTEEPANGEDAELSPSKPSPIDNAAEDPLQQFLRQL